jgi:O-antigen ligase
VLCEAEAKLSRYRKKACSAFLLKIELLKTELLKTEPGLSRQGSSLMDNLLQPRVGGAAAGAAQESVWRSKLGLCLAFVGLVFAGLVLSLVGRSLVDRFGSTATIILILAAPPILVVSVIAFRQFLSKFRTLRKQLTWWHWLWLIMVVSNFVFRTRDIGSVQENPLDAAAVFRVGLVGITAFSLLVRLVLRRPNWLESLFRGLVGIVAVFALVCILSSIWSFNPPWTLYKSCEYLVDISLLATILATVHSTEAFESLMDWTWVICGLLVVVAWLEAPIWPNEALEGAGGYMGGPLQYRLSGVYPGQGFNMLGTYGAILATIAICRLLPAPGRKFDRAWYVMLFVLGAVTMVFAQTRSAIGGFVVGAILAFILTKRIRLGVTLGVASAGVLAFTGASHTILDFLQRGQSQEQIASLSGRLEWWGVAWEAFKQHPLTGYGAFTSGMSVFPKLGVKEITPLHSDYVETLVGIGIWGPLLIIIGLLGTWWILVRYNSRFSPTSLERQLAVEAIAVLGVLTVRTTVMGVIMSQPPIQYFAILGYAEYLRRRYGRGAASTS